MNLGDLLLKLAVLGAAVASLLFVAPLRGRRSPRAADWAFASHAFLLLAAMLLLGVYFVAHRFEYEYVAHYSSRALSPAMSLAASWAGQEGSILLWSMIGGLLGLALLRQPGPLTRPAMFFVSLAQLFMMILLLVKNPFRMLPAAPPDGQGLNPLLEDPWMIIHPPVLFIGYAALLVYFPFAWLVIIPALLPIMDFAPWTGRFFFDEFDLVILTTLAFYYWQKPAERTRSLL